MGVWVCAMMGGDQKAEKTKLTKGLLFKGRKRRKI